MSTHPSTSPRRAAPADVDDLLVDALMTRRVVAISADATLTVALRLMASHGVRHLPVFEGPSCVGLLHEVDVLGGIATWVISLGPPPSVRGFHRRAVTVCALERRSAAALRMAAEGSDVALVTEGDAVLGIVTATDLIRSLAGEAESDGP